MKVAKLRQKGASLMEVLVAMSISLVVTASMIALMSNSLGSTARIVKMTKLADDMRVAMQMMTRDVRRGSYNANSMYCYANDNCASDGSPVTLIDSDNNVAGIIDIQDGDGDGTDDCFAFLMDRDFDGDSTKDDAADNKAGGFRRVEVDPDNDGEFVGMLEMWTGEGIPACDAAPYSDDWVAVTDPEDMDIFVFAVDDNLSYTEVIQNDAAGNRLSQQVRKIRMNMQGRLVYDPTIVRRVEDVITVRNDVLFDPDVVSL